MVIVESSKTALSVDTLIGLFLEFESKVSAFCVTIMAAELARAIFSSR